MSMKECPRSRRRREGKTKGGKSRVHEALLVERELSNKCEDKEARVK